MSDRRTFAVAIFCRNAGEILLIRHKRLGLWLPVGGELDLGEPPLEAARRELKEETGLVGSFVPSARLAYLGVLATALISFPGGRPRSRACRW